jgi:hypothetical protein
MGDIARAAENEQTSVAINTRFTKLHGYEYMRARKLFLENEKINALPIVDADDRLLGDYTRWDDVPVLSDIDALKDSRYVKEFFQKYKHIALLMPGKLFPKKREWMERWRDFLRNAGVKTDVIEKSDLAGACDSYDLIVTADEDENRSAETIYRIVPNSVVVFLEWNDCVNEIRLLETGAYARTILAEPILHRLSQSGVFPMTIQCGSNGSDYWKNLNSEIDERFYHIRREKGSALIEEFWQDFFGEIYNYHYAKEISMLPRNLKLTRRCGIVTLDDADTEIYHVKGGERLTVGQPETYDRTIWFFGPCIVEGFFAEDAHTIESYLQGFLNDDGYRIRVVNYGAWRDAAALWNQIGQAEFKQGDMVVVYDGDKSFEGIPNLNLATVWNNIRFRQNGWLMVHCIVIIR